jgi:hypothetical protein
MTDDFGPLRQAMSDLADNGVSRSPPASRPRRRCSSSAGRSPSPPPTVRPRRRRWRPRRRHPASPRPPRRRGQHRRHRRRRRRHRRRRHPHPLGPATDPSIPTAPRRRPSRSWSTCPRAGTSFRPVWSAGGTGRRLTRRARPPVTASTCSGTRPARAGGITARAADTTARISASPRATRRSARWISASSRPRGVGDTHPMEDGWTHIGRVGCHYSDKRVTWAVSDDRRARAFWS